jgi:uncharacterized protein YndB with AHSA1/START domain
VADIRHLIRIQAPPERVYRALTTADGVRGWWTPDADLESRIGGTGQFRFYGGASVIAVMVDDLAPPVRVGWTTTASFHPEWMGTTLAFDLQAEGGDTLLSFAHRGFEQADDRYAMFDTGWGVYLERLKQAVETGAAATG